MITPEQALSARNFNQVIGIDEMAKLLIPRGVDANQVAGLAFSGAWWGEESNRYDRLVETFEGYADDEDPSVKVVGRAGVEMFSRARDEAAAKERKARVRGQL